MNNKKIKNLEEKFFETYPEGFNDPEMIKVSKKHNLEKDLLIKPTTTKSILNYFEVKDIKYNSKPSYEFYSKYRDFINNLKKEVTPSLAPNNPAFLGFLMLTIPKK
ncbi:MAG: hypothetical protein PWP46_46 [Fusobacteriaceae bacterium]|nr:hypothetical protein [Fusobacteriaceae bacterium]